jgi:hypothetical protein
MTQPLWVRTPLRLQVWGSTVRIEFTASDEPAGQMGEKLKAGRGAFVDRTLDPDEPALILVDDVNPDVLNLFPEKPLTQQGVQKVINSLFPALVETMALRAALLTDGTRIGFNVKKASAVGPIGIFGRELVFECLNGYGRMPPPSSPFVTQPYIILPVERQ